MSRTRACHDKYSSLEPGITKRYFYWHVTYWLRSSKVTLHMRAYQIHGLRGGSGGNNRGRPPNCVHSVFGFMTPFSVLRLHLIIQPDIRSQPNNANIGMTKTSQIEKLEKNYSQNNVDTRLILIFDKIFGRIWHVFHGILLNYIFSRAQSPNLLLFSTTSIFAKYSNYSEKIEPNIRRHKTGKLDNPSVNVTPMFVVHTLWRIALRSKFGSYQLPQVLGMYIHEHLAPGVVPVGAVGPQAPHQTTSTFLLGELSLRQIDVFNW